MASSSKKEHFLELMNSTKLSKQDVVKLLLESITKDEQAKRENKELDSKGTMNKFAFTSALKTGEAAFVNVREPNSINKIAIHSSVFDCIDKPYSKGLSRTLGTLERLGKGGFGAAYKFTPDLGAGTPTIHVVIKCTTKLDSDNPKPSWHREIQHTRKLNHQNVIKYYGEPIIYNSNVYNVMEFGGQSIAKRYFQQRQMLMDDVKKAAYAVSSGLDYLHSARAGANYIVHRDIRCDNVVVNEDGVYKIIDFGISSKTTVEHSRFDSEAHWGHPFWKSPEYCKYMTAQGAVIAPRNLKPPGRKADVWSFGVLVLEMMSFPERPKYFYGKQVFIQDLARGRINMRTHFKETWPLPLREILSECFEVEEVRRADSKHLKTLCANFFHSKDSEIAVDVSTDGNVKTAQELAERDCDIVEATKSCGLEIHQRYFTNRMPGCMGPLMLPPVPKQHFVDVFSAEDLTKKRIQREINMQLQGEAEIEVYRALESLENEQMIVLAQFKYTHAQYERFVGNHECKKKDNEIEGESDFLVLLENIVVVINVKAPQLRGDNSDKQFGRNLKDSLVQRVRTHDFVMDVYEKMGSVGESPIILGFSIFSKIERTSVESFSTYKRKEDAEKNSIVFKEDMATFPSWWKANVVSRLNHFSPGNEHQPNVRSTLMGLWCIDDKNICLKYSCSLGHWIKEVNKVLRSISRRPEAPISSNVKGAPYIFKKHLEIDCITEAQKNIFHESGSCLLICGPSGSGKTVLMLGKIIDLVVKLKTEKVVLIVRGESSAKHCKRLLGEAFGSDGIEDIDAVVKKIDISDNNEIATWLLQQIDSAPQQVVILWRESAPFAPYANLMADLLEVLVANHCHTFIDDVQDILHSETEDNKARVLEICSSVFNQVPSTEDAVSRSTLWVSCDIAQDSSSVTEGKRINCFNRFPIASRKILKANLRNTFEISKLLAIIREEIISINPVLNDMADIASLEQRLGHYIHGPKPHLYVLSCGEESAVSKIINCELDKLESTENIALVAGVSQHHWKDRLEDIAQKRTCARAIGVFAAEDTLSSEWPAVIAVVEAVHTQTTGDFYNILYKLISRAKVYCAVIVLLPSAQSYEDLFRKIGPLCKHVHV